MKRTLSQCGLLLTISLWYLIKIGLVSFYEGIQMMGKDKRCFQR